MSELRNGRLSSCCNAAGLTLGGTPGMRLNAHGWVVELHCMSNLYWPHHFVSQSTLTLSKSDFEGVLFTYV